MECVNVYFSDTLLPYEIRRLLKWKMSTITPNVIKQCIAMVGFTKAKSEYLPKCLFHSINKLFYHSYSFYVYFSCS